MTEEGGEGEQHAVAEHVIVEQEDDLVVLDACARRQQVVADLANAQVWKLRHKHVTCHSITLQQVNNLQIRDKTKDTCSDGTKLRDGNEQLTLARSEQKQ